MRVQPSACPRIAISWNGLPQYAARQIRAAIEQLGESCIVVGSKPTVPVAGMEAALGCHVDWICADAPTSWRALGYAVPEIYVQSGWSYPAFSSLGAEVKASGGRVIGLSDANWRGDFRQLVLGSIGFRMRHKSRFDAMIVPGLQGLRLMRWFGLSADCVIGGMYGADPSVFRGGPPLAERPKTFLFVGQFIPRKDVLGLARAFLRLVETHPYWTLHICGSGEQQGLIPIHERIVVENFVQPEQLASRFHAARFFVLPSHSEAWGLVVHEAALCGCALILSDKIGSADDLANGANAIRFKAGSERAILAALSDATNWDEPRLRQAEQVSRELATPFGPKRFGREIANLVAQFRGKNREHSR